MSPPRASFDVIVIGGGHAGCEAASAAARMGARTTLVTHRFATIGAMSCNPAIGGLGKGHLVREVDAFDGLMGRAADAGGIQFRMLNRRKGPAVRGPRAQADRKLYARAMQAAIIATADLSVIEGEADELLISNNRVIGVRLADGRELPAGATKLAIPKRACACSCGGAVVITTGTFLRGLIHLGEKNWPAGRVGEAPSLGLSASFERLGFKLGRLKTGTPPRLDGATIDWSAVEMQPGDDPPEPFSVLTKQITTPQIQCGITRTTPATHELIRANVHRSPIYSWSLRASMTPRFIRTASQPPCPRKFNSPFSRPFRALSGSAWSGQATPSNTTISIHANSIRPCRPSGCRAFSWPARSTARPVMKRRRRKESSPV